MPPAAPRPVRPSLLTRLRLALRNLLAFGLVSLVLVSSNLPLTDFNGQVRAFTRPVEFDFVTWTLDAIGVKWTQLALGADDFLPVERRSALVLAYLEVLGQSRQVERELRDLLADPNLPDPQAAAAPVREQLADLLSERDRLAPLAEAVLQAQCSQVLAEIGLSLAGQPVPPVLYHVSPPPSALIVSRRDQIAQLENISVEPGLTLDEIIALEESVAASLDVSTLVVGIGGIGIYPTMVMPTTDINTLAEVVAHEWIHNYLTLRPLGANYLASGELRTFNETVASLAGKEIGRLIVAEFYPAYLPPEPQPTPTPDPAATPTPTPEPQPPVFDFNAEMRLTRQTVDALLADGQVAQAETYMEQRRTFFWDNGYRLRKLNQAYFAFYGAYADAPGGGAAGEDPVGAAVRRLREQIPDLTEFINTVAWMWRVEQLNAAVE